MPKITWIKQETPSKIDQEKRITSILKAASCAAGYDNYNELSSVTGISYQVLQRRMSGQAKFSLRDIAILRTVLPLNAGDCAALCGDPTPCRYEAGYQPH